MIIITLLSLFSTFSPYGSAEKEVYAQNVLDGKKIYTHFSVHAKGEGKELVPCSVKVQNGGSVQVPIEIHDFEKGKNELMFVWIVITNEDDIWLEPSDSWEYFDYLHCDVNIQDTYGRI